MLKLLIIIKLILFKLLKKKILVVSNASGLGDYLWGRYYFELLKKQYNEYKFVLIGTKRWIDFAQYNDSHIFDIFVPVSNPTKISNKRVRIILKLLLPDILVNISNWEPITKLIKAKKEYRCKYYPTQFYKENMFDFYKDFIKIPNDYKSKFKFSSKISENNYILLALGGYAQGSFSKKQLIDIVEYILKNTKYNVFLIGNDKDIELYEYIYKTISNSERLLNGVNVYNSFDIPEIVKKAVFVITPNTSIYHFAKLLDKFCVCVSAGEPETIDINSNDKKFLYVVDDRLQEMINNGNWHDYISLKSDVKIADFEPEKIIDCVEKMLKRID